jgi:hypothetical protein
MSSSPVITKGNGNSGAVSEYQGATKILDKPKFINVYLVKLSFLNMKLVLKT